MTPRRDDPTAFLLAWLVACLLAGSLIWQWFEAVI